jgi:electron transfer flavoprotein alpha subunit
MNDTLVFIENRNAVIKKASLEALSTANLLTAQAGGGKVSALIIGKNSDGLIGTIKEYGPDIIYMIDSADADIYNAKIYTNIMLKCMESAKPKLVLSAHTSMATDFLPMSAALTGAGMVTDCIEIKIEGGKLKAKKPIYAGKIIAEFESASDICFVTLRPKVFKIEKKQKESVVEKLAISIDKSKIKAVLKNTLKAESEEMDVSEADVIVSGGRGVKGPEGFQPLHELAKLLNGAVGASRSAVDSGWISHPHQVGQTGKTVSPNLYLACGISGKIQHLAGMSSSKHIVAVNKDPEAPIFGLCDLGIIGDLFKVIPATLEEIKKRK